MANHPTDERRLFLMILAVVTAVVIGFLLFLGVGKVVVSNNTSPTPEDAASQAEATPSPDTSSIPVLKDEYQDRSDPFPEDSPFPLDPAGGSKTLSDDFSDNEGYPFSQWKEFGASGLYLEDYYQLTWGEERRKLEHALLFEQPLDANAFTMQVTCSAQDLTGHLHLYFLVQDSENWYRLVIYYSSEKNGNSAIRFEKKVDGKFTVLGHTPPSLTFNKSGVDWQLTVISDPQTNTLSFFSDKGDRLSVQETVEFPGGLFGLGAKDRIPTWKDFLVKAASAQD